MAYDVSSAFDQFDRAMSLSGAHHDTAEARRKRVVELLGTQFTIMDTLATGSILRGTALSGQADVDIIVALHFGRHVRGKSPRQLLESVRDALAGTSKIVKKNGQAVTLYFTKWPNVDVVPCSLTYGDRGTINHYNVPDMNNNRWIEARPRRHDRAMHAVSANKRRLVRMVKQWNVAHSDLMQSYHLEVIALRIPEVSTDWALEVYWYFKSAAELIDQALVHPNGSPGRVDAYLDWSARAEVKTRLIRARDWATTAWSLVNSDPVEAMRLYRLIFGNEFPAYG